MPNTTYTIQMASKISGVGVHTIRAWEKRYKALDPNRDASGHRTYTKLDIEKLMLLSELCLLGYTISKVAGLELIELKALLRDLGKTEESEALDFDLVHEKHSTIDPAQSLPILNFALKNYKIGVISQELGKLKSVLTSRDFALEIIYPVSLTLAVFFKSGEYTAPQEEVVRSLIRFHTGYNLYHPAEKKEKGHINVFIGGMEGVVNDIFLSCVGLLCHNYGYNYTYAGPDLSYEALSDEARFLEAQLIIISPNGNIEKLMSKIVAEADVLVVGATDLNLERLNDKRLKVLKTLNAVDEFLAQKT